MEARLIEELVKVRFEGASKECAICMAEFYTGEEVTVLPCEAHH